MFWMIFIFQASALPPEEVDRTLQGLLWLGKLRSVLGHLVLYGVLAFLLQISLWGWKSNTAYQLRWALAMAALATLYGVTDEYHQSLVPGRVTSLADIVIDGVGALTAAVSLRFIAGMALTRFRSD
jgi:VanZ family protein